MNVEDIASRISVIFGIQHDWSEFFGYVSPGSVETLVRGGGTTSHHLIAHSLSNVSAKKLLKSVNVRWSYSVLNQCRFFLDTVYIWLQSSSEMQTRLYKCHVHLMRCRRETVTMWSGLIDVLVDRLCRARSVVVVSMRCRSWRRTWSSSRSSMRRRRRVSRNVIRRRSTTSPTSSSNSTDSATSHSLHCTLLKILWRVFYILTEPVPYTFVFVNQQNNEAQTHRFTDTNVCGTGFFKLWKTRHKISVDERIFVHCRHFL